MAACEIVFKEAYLIKCIICSQKPTINLIYAPENNVGNDVDTSTEVPLYIKKHTFTFACTPPPQVRTERDTNSESSMSQQIIFLNLKTINSNLHIQT